jgi:hypothetical protein
MSFATGIPAGGPDLGDVGAEIRRVPLDLQSLFLQVGAVDGIYVVVEDVPAGIRLSAGRYNGNDTWSLAPGQLDGLQAILPPDRIEPFVLTVRILIPDPGGYDYASTAARCELIVCPDRESAVAVAARTPWERPAGRGLGQSSPPFRATRWQQGIATFPQRGPNGRSRKRFVSRALARIGRAPKRSVGWCANLNFGVNCLLNWPTPKPDGLAGRPAVSRRSRPNGLHDSPRAKLGCERSRISIDV